MTINQTFKEQRLDRLKDSISEYLDDSDGSADEFLADLIKALIEGRKYFQERSDDYTKVISNIIAK